MLLIAAECDNDRRVLDPLIRELMTRGIPHETTVDYCDEPDARLKTAHLGATDTVVVANHFWVEWFKKDREFLGLQDRPMPKIVWTMHEFVSSKASMAMNLNLVDYACVPNDYVESYLRNPPVEVCGGCGPFKGESWPTGYVQLDPMHEMMGKAMRWRADSMLVAPTSNYKFTDGLQYLHDYDGDATVTVKAHSEAMSAYHYESDGRKVPIKPPDWVHWEDANADLIPCILSHWLQVGDMGSAMFLQLMSGRPCLVYDSYRWWDDADNFDKRDGAFEFRKAFYTFSSGEQLSLLVDCLLGGCDPLAPKREALMRRLSVYQGKNLFDGRAAERIADKLEELL